ncbi:MAG: pentapeptide repeat-containing protein [Elainellaceae cyanobacterium]
MTSDPDARLIKAPEALSEDDRVAEGPAAEGSAGESEGLSSELIGAQTPSASSNGASMISGEAQSGEAGGLSVDNIEVNGAGEKGPETKPAQTVARAASGNLAASRAGGSAATATADAEQRLMQYSPAPPGSLIVLLSIGIIILGAVFDTAWLVVTGALVSLLVSIRMSWVVLQPVLFELISPQQRSLTVAILGIIAAAIGLLRVIGAGQWIGPWFASLNWDAVGATGDVFGALGQILIAILAVYVAWRQYVISKDLTIQQNLITQQQTIDAYFQGISDLVLDAEGLLEDWPQERAIAEGRTGAILSSVDAPGKAKIVRFLSRSRLLTPLRRDRHLGRAMLDGMGGYQEDRDYGIRVIDLGVMLAAANLAGTDLRWTDISDANLVRANLIRCDLVKANLARTILYEANLMEADLMGARLFYGDIETATPRSRTQPPDYKTGECTGAVVENANFSGVKRLSDQQRRYICSWCGSNSRSTVPGGCQDIPNRLGR